MQGFFQRRHGCERIALVRPTGYISEGFLQNMYCKCIVVVQFILNAQKNTVLFIFSSLKKKNVKKC
jgi:hypothetical protein